MEDKVKKVFGIRFLLLLTLVFLFTQTGFGCSGYKITLGNKTLFGSNEDAWRVTPHIWFENVGASGAYGVAFTGSRHDGEFGYAPQAGMNEAGLAFERLSAYHPKNTSDTFAGRKKITQPTNYLKDILHRCKTVEEVQAYINTYDHSYFIEDVFIYADKAGNYLVVEPYSTILGNDPTYVIANFCPSITPEHQAKQMARYKNGVEFLKGRLDTSLAFCTALSDTMHVCRDKIGDGTLLTSIWDLQNGTVSLYFYHNYDRVVQFNLNEELQRGDRQIAIASLFAPNVEFEKLRTFKTPKNTGWMGAFLVGAAGLFLFTSLFFLIKYLRRKPNTQYAFWQLLIFPLGLMLFYYMVVLSGSISVFYFSAPYEDPGNIFVSLSSYMPFLLLGLIVPFCWVNLKLFKEITWGNFAKSLFFLNTMTYLVLIGFFVYWGFYEVFNG